MWGDVLVISKGWSTNISYRLRSQLQWRHNQRHGASNHRHLHCLLHCWYRPRSKKAWKLRVTGLWAGNSPVTVEFPAQKASNAENVSIWWRHHVSTSCEIVPRWMSHTTSDNSNTAWAMAWCRLALWCVPCRYPKQTAERPVIWTTMTLLWR